MKLIGMQTSISIRQLSGNFEVEYMDYDVYEYDEWYWDSIPVDDIYDTAEEINLKGYDD